MFGVRPVYGIPWCRTTPSCTSLEATEGKGSSRHLPSPRVTCVCIYIYNFKLGLVPDTSKSLPRFKGLGCLGKCNVLGHLEWHCFFGIKWALIMQW